MKLLLSFILISITSHLMAQHFSGTITYKTTIEPKNNTIDMATIENNSPPGKTKYYTITDGFYKSVYKEDNTFTYSYTYHDSTKLMYDDYADRPYITYRDSRKATTGSIISKINRDTVVTYLDLPCFVVTAVAEDYISTRLYSDKVRVNYTTFEGHAVGNWYNQLKELEGAISLKTITKYEDYTEITEAVAIDRRPVALDEFALPADKPVVASYAALEEKVNLGQPTQEQIDCYRKKLLEGQKLKPNNTAQGIETYVRFILKANGTKELIEAYQPDPYGLHEVAIDIVKTCDLPFTPGKIDDQNVDTDVIFPIEF